MKWNLKRFEQLSAAELYQVLQLRSEVFVVEQNCVYQDIDGKDCGAVHLIGDSEGSVVAYARLFQPGDYFQQASIGRVVVAANFRSQKTGHELMKRAVAAVEKLFGVTHIRISAQAYLQKFYESHGFSVIGDPYLEDDIPHLRMEKR